jgi:ABC-type uncharacterized transport system YnjBCD ATPase subunit
MLASRARLPAYSCRAEVLSAVAGSDVVVISGATGCGKSTQVGRGGVKWMVYGLPEGQGATSAIGAADVRLAAWKGLRVLLNSIALLYNFALLYNLV